MYPFVLAVHNLMRWIILVTALIAIARAVMGWQGNRSWTPTDDRWGLLYTLAMDVQLIVGLLLYFVFSPITRQALGNIGSAMANSDLRFFVIEHFAVMILAVIVAHIGRALSRRREQPVSKHRLAAIFFTLSFILVLFAIPWWRPLLPFG